MSEGFGGKETDLGGGWGFGEVPSGGVEAEDFGALGGIAIQDKCRSLAGNTTNLGGGGRRDKDIAGGGVLDDAPSEFPAIPEADQVWRGGLCEAESRG